MQTAFLYSLKCIYNIGLNSYKFTLKTSNDEILTAKQIQKLQRENAQHKGKPLIKKVIAIFILHPNKD